MIRVPDTPANRTVSGSVGTSDDSAPFPWLRALPLNDVSTRALLGMPHGPAGTDEAAAEQALLDEAMGTIRTCSRRTGSGSWSGSITARPGSPG